MSAEPGVTVRESQRQDEPRVIELLRTTFGRWPPEIDSMTPPEFFHWKHRSGPFGASRLFLSELEGELVGVVAYMPWQFLADGQTLTAMRGVDFAVDSRFRRRGVGIAIRTAAASSFTDASFIWANPNVPALGGGLKVGRRSSGRIPNFVRLCGRPLQTGRRMRGGRAATPDRLDVDAPSAGAVLEDDEYMHAVLARTAPPPRSLATVRHIDYLRWRYGQLEEYRALRASPASAPAGIVIFRLRRFGALWVADVCELLLEQRARALARRLLRGVRNSAASDLLMCNFRSRRAAAAHGFVEVSRGVTLMTYPIGQRTAPDPTVGRSWALSRGDLELL
jgi:GNAT superfamily N-acetyltransferase